jgi:nucleoside-diphosphate-sugar epimerase
VANYVYVKDVSAAILHFTEHPEHTGIYNLGSSVPIQSFISFFRKLIPEPVKHFVLPDFVFALFNLSGKSKVKALSNAVRYSDEKLKKVFTYPYGVEKGIERTLGGG